MTKLERLYLEMAAIEGLMFAPESLKKIMSSYYLSHIKEIEAGKTENPIVDIAGEDDLKEAAKDGNQKA